MNILNLKKILDKNPKSKIFALIADGLREESHVKGYEQKLEEALAVVNKGLEENRGFLPGHFARGRVLFEKGDFVGAVADFEMVAEQDPFCLSAKQLLLEVLEKQGQPPKTEIYAKILSAFGTEYVSETKKATETEKTPKTEKELDIKPYVATGAAAKPASVNAALDNILIEEETKENETSELLLQSFGNIFEQPKESIESLPPVVESILEKEPSAEVKNIPQEIPQAFESTSISTPDIVSTSIPSPQAPNVEDLIKEQLVDKEENLPDLTSDIKSLLETNAPPPAAAQPAPVSAEDLIKEQLADKAENLPDLTSDMKSLLESHAPPPPPAAEPKLEPYKSKQPAPVSVDDLIKEQLADKTENVPDLTGDMDSLLKTNEIIAQTPTPTLAELYIDQGLPQKAVEVYKELLANDPKNAELQKKLALAEAQI